MIEPHPEDVKQLVRHLRSRCDLNQEQFAAAAGLDVSTIGRYESGERVPDRETIERLAAVAGLPAGIVWYCLLPAFRAARLAAGAHRGGAGGVAPSDLAQGIGESCGQAAAPAAAGFQGSLAAALAKPWERAEPCPADRAVAEDLWNRIRGLSDQDRWEVLEKAPSFRTWALAERMAQESALAAAQGRECALALARQAVWIAERIPCTTEAWRSLVRGYTTPFVANVLRAASDLPGAKAAFAEGWRLWKEGAEAHPAGLLAEWRLFDLEASLLRAQRFLPEAIERLDRALADAPAEARGRILLKKGFTLEQMGRFEDALATLTEAASLVDAERELRLAFGIAFNTAVNLVHLSRGDEAHALLPEVRRLQGRLDNDLDRARVRWLEGRVAAARADRAEAEAAFDEVARAFEAHNRPFDVALADLDLALLLREQGRWPEIQRLATRMLEIFQAQGVHREAVASVVLFREAAVKEAVTVDLVRRLKDYLGQAQAQPAARFDAQP